jgi:TetR/AcrR family transcriptional regulator
MLHRGGTLGIAERREREREQRRSAIIDAAERIFFSKGIANATMDDVAEAAELSKGTLYLYFNSKEDLYLAIILRAIALLQNRLGSAAHSHERGADKIEAIGRAYFSFCKDHPDYFHAMLFFESYDVDPDGAPGYGVECAKQSKQTFEICAAAVQAGIDDGSIRSDLDPMKTALTLYGLSTGLLQIISIKGRMIREEQGLDPEDLVETFFQLIERSLGT